MGKIIDDQQERILMYSREPEIFLSDLRQRKETALKLGGDVIKNLRFQIAQENDPKKASLLVRLALECGLLDKSSGSWDIAHIDAALAHLENTLAQYRLDNAFQEIIVDALEAGERLRDDYLRLFNRLARKAFLHANEKIPVTALVNLLHLAKQKIRRAYDGYSFPYYFWEEVAETLLELGVQDAVEPIIEHLETDRCWFDRRTYQSIRLKLLRMINIEDPVTLKRFMASKREYERRFILIEGCVNRETIWNDKESQKCLESIYLNDSDRTIRYLAAFVLARSGRKDLAHVLLEFFEESEFFENFSKLDKTADTASRCIHLLCSFRESRALPIFIKFLRKPEGGRQPYIPDFEEKLSASLLDNANYMHFPDKEMAEILCVLLEKADLNYLDRLTDALIKLGNRQIIDTLEKFNSSDERRFVAAFKTLAGLNEAERLINLLLNSEGLRASAVGKVLSSIIDKSLEENILSAYQPQLPWSRRKALIMSLKGSREILARLLEIEKDYDLRQFIEETISD